MVFDVGTNADKFIQLPPNLDAPIFQMQIDIKRYFQRINFTLVFMRTVDNGRKSQSLLRFIYKCFHLSSYIYIQSPQTFFFVLFL